jgi:hypothetical protein
MRFRNRTFGCCFEDANENVKLRFITVAVGLLGFGVVACSGSVGTTPPPGPPVPTPAPLYEYAGSITQRYAYDYGYPSPQPPTTIRTRIRDKVSVLSATGSGLPAGARNVHVLERAATRLQTTDTVSDSYVSAQEPELLLYGSKSQLEAPLGGQSTETVTTYSKPQILAKQSGRWTNSPAAKIDESFSDGHHQNRTIAANGTYVEKGTTFALNGKVAPIEILEEASGAGSYTGPFVGCPPNTSWMFTAAPSITLTLVSKPRERGCELGATPIPDWYRVPPTFYSERDTVKSDVTMPSQCGGLAGTAATYVRRTVSSLDTVIGYVESTDVSAYSNAQGVPLCLLLDDDISNYYDWQGDQVAFFAFTPNGDAVSTIDTQESLVLAGGNPSSMVAGEGIGPGAAVVVGLQQPFLARNSVEREKLRNAMVHHLENLARRIGGVR